MLMQKGTGSERRRFVRFMIDLPVKYSSRPDSFLRYGKSGRTVNVSEGGLLVLLPEEIGIGQRLAMQLFLTSGDGLNTLETSAHVVWSGIQLRKDWGWDYRTGMRFAGISAEEMIKFKDFLRTLS